MNAEDDFLGNEKIKRYLDRTSKQGCVSHAYLFEGPEHVGKTTLALAFAAQLLGDRSADVTRNPDLILVSPEEDKKQIGAEQIRDLQKTLSLSPFQSPYKIAIIEQAEKMNRTAANALLKTLEEPGQTSILILVSSQAEKLLDTIKSRCQVLSFGIAPRQGMEEFLRRRCQKSVPPAVLEIAEGKPGLAIRLLDDPESLAAQEEQRLQVLRLFDLGSAGRLEAAGPIYALEKDQVIELLDLWTGTLRRQLLNSLAGPGEEATERTHRYKSAIDHIIAIREDIAEKNVNLKLAIENLCLRF